MTKSALAVAREALEVARKSFPAYTHSRSRKDYTQHQLFALLAVRQFFDTDYRGIEQLAREWSDLRSTLGIKKVPDHSTLQRAANRMLEKRGSTPSSPPVSMLRVA
jgi:hypothetical protein